MQYTRYNCLSSLSNKVHISNWQEVTEHKIPVGKQALHSKSHGSLLRQENDHNSFSKIIIENRMNGRQYIS